MNEQQELTQFTHLEILSLKLPKLRAVDAVWEKDSAKISFYFDGEISERIMKRLQMLVQKSLLTSPMVF